MLRGKFLLLAAVVAFISGSTAFSQPTAPVAAPPDPQFVQNALAVLQQQRNRALDEAAQAQAQAALLQGKLEAANKELADLRAKEKPTEPRSEPEKK